MPAAKRSTRSSSRTSKFKEPAAFKRLTKSLDTAQEALAELSKQGGRDVGQSAGAISKDLRTFVTNARRHSGRLGKALARDFEQAQKKLSKATTTSSSRRTTTRAKSGTTRAKSSASRAKSSSARTTSSRSGSASRTKRAGTSSGRTKS